jgi:hypothetical protein
MISSASAARSGGIDKPRAFAVSRLINNSNFVGCWTGKSVQQSPLHVTEIGQALFERLPDSRPARR